MGKVDTKAGDPAGDAVLHIVPAEPAVAGAALQEEVHPGDAYKYTGQ